MLKQFTTDHTAPIVIKLPFEPTVTTNEVMANPFLKYEEDAQKIEVMNLKRIN